MLVAVRHRALAVACMVLLCTSLLPATTRGAALPSPVQLDSTTVAVPSTLVAAISTSLAQCPADLMVGTRFRIIAAVVEGGWALVSVVALDAPALDPHAPGAGGLSKLIVAQQRSDGTWRTAIDGEPAFADVIAATPPALLAPDAKAILAADPALHTVRQSTNTTSTVNYKFPWPAGQAWGWWQGWHDSAHDLGTTGSDRRVLAAADGVVSGIYSCTLSTIIDLQHADGAVFRYVHLDKQSVNTETIRVGVRVPQGLVLGLVRPDTWSDGDCGYTTQSPGWAHLHWVIPTDRPVTVDGWTIQFPANAWSKNGVAKVPGYGTASTFPSTNTPSTTRVPATSNLTQHVFVPMFGTR